MSDPYLMMPVYDGGDVPIGGSDIGIPTRPYHDRYMIPDFRGETDYYGDYANYSVKESKMMRDLMEGDQTRRMLNITFIVLAVGVMIFMLYIAYAALADRVPFSDRVWAPGGRNLPKPVERTTT